MDCSVCGRWIDELVAPICNSCADKRGAVLCDSFECPETAVWEKGLCEKHLQQQQAAVDLYHEFAGVLPTERTK